MATTTSNKRKKAVAATVAAAALLLGGTFAWTSISQTALNEAIVDINPGGRLHDDFNGTNKDVYVENFNTDVDAVPIFARIKLTEYVELGPEAGKKDISDADRNAESWPEGELALEAEPDTWQTYIPTTSELRNDSNVSDEFWILQWGNDDSNMPYYLPTFNKNKDSLKADINGTYEGTVDGDIVHYDDYVVYDESSDPVTGTEVVDWDENTIDEGDTALPVVDPDKNPFGTEPYNIKEIPDLEHPIAQVTTTATVMTMQEWLDGNYGIGPYWVYDEDGWAYWAQPIQPGETTGLFLDGIQMHKVPDENWYYGLNAIGQFATESDINVFSDMDTENGGGGGTTGNADYLLQVITGNTDEGGGGIEPPPGETYTDELVLSHDSRTDAVSGGEWLIFNAQVYDENGQWIAGTYDVDYKVTDQDGNELTQDGVAAASTGTSGFTSTYMKDNNLFVADNIQETDIESLTVTASYEHDGSKSYEKSVTLSVGANENPMSIALNYNGTPISHLAGTENVYQIQTTDVGNDTFDFSAALQGSVVSEGLQWSIGDMADYPRGYTVEASADGKSWNVVANAMWTEEYATWRTVEEGTLLAQINKSTGAFRVLLDPELYPGSMTFYINAQTADGEHSKTDILFISYQPVIFYLENDDVTGIMEKHSASFTKGEDTEVTLKAVRLIGGEEQPIGEDILNSLTLYYGQYGGANEGNPVPTEYYSVVPNVDAGTAKLTLNIPTTVEEDYVYVRATYDHGTATVNAADGIYHYRFTMQSASVVKEGIANVNIEDYSGANGQYTSGAYTKISLSARALTASNESVWDATYGWSVNVDGAPSDLVKLKFEKGQPNAELWILGLVEGDINVTVACSEAGKSETAAVTTYTLSPVEATE